MISHRLTSLLLFASLVSLVVTAPMDEPATSASTSTAPPTLTSAAADQTASAPATYGDSKPENAATASMAVSSSHEARLSNTSFTCFGRHIGYYTDAEHECKVYHFCLPGEYNGEIVYQRISYLCLNETVFDQQALDCVESSKLSAPCADSAKYYDSSNAILRQAIVGGNNTSQTSVDSGSSKNADAQNTTSTTTTPTPSS